MIKYTLRLLALLLLPAGAAFAQSVRKPMRIDNPKPLRDARLVILSEAHLQSELGECKTRLIENLRAEGLTDVIFEMGRSYAYLFNQAVCTGDTNVLGPYSKQAWPSQEPRYWGSVCDYRDGRLRAHGIDRESIFLVPAVRYMLERQHRTDNELYRYILTLSDTILRLPRGLRPPVERRRIIGRMLRICRSDKSYYGSIGDSLGSLRDFYENPVHPWHIRRRFRDMERNVADVYVPGHKYLQIVGAAHVRNRRPIYRELIERHHLNTSDVCVISVLTKGCLSQPGINNRRAVLKAEDQMSPVPRERADAYLRDHAHPDRYEVVDIAAEHAGDHFDYVLPIDCTL